MRLRLDGDLRRFAPIRLFRADHSLPASFGVALFEPKDYTGLGSIDGAGASLNRVREAVLNVLPDQMPAAAWLSFIPQLTTLFTAELYAINHAVRLKDVEIDFAAAGFGDVCQAYAYALVRGRASNLHAPDFEMVYDDWLDSTVRISQTVYPYNHNGAIWKIQIVTHAYGRAGMIVTMPTETCFVHDPSLGCPAEGFMLSLLREVAQRMATATK